MSQAVECPRCHRSVSGTARRRGRCTACGASLASANAKVSDVRDLLHGRRAPIPLRAHDTRERSALR